MERDPRPFMDEGQHWPIVDMLDRNSLHLEKVFATEEGIIVPPGGVLLAQTVEVFNLPNWLSGEYKLKSTMARNFFNHLNAGWADAGWNGSVLTLEFVNHNQWHSVRVRPGQKCGQMIFFEHDEVSTEASYATKGQYNGDKEATPGKGLK
jgi:deoxycytidine triphosphate deaminase